MKTADPAAEELAAINAILEPWMWVDTYAQPYHGLLTGRIATGPYRFEGIIKPDPGKMTRGHATGRSARASLMERAEDAFGALAAGGWQLMHRLSMELSGNIAPFTQTFGGELAEPGEHYDLELKVRFEVQRPR